MHNKINQLFGIQYPIIQGGMVWCSGWRLASAVSNCGGLGLIGAGSMHPPVLREHIQKCKLATSFPFGVNVPLLYPEIDTLMQIIVAEGVKIVFTSAGNPAIWTQYLKDNGIKVVHVIANSKFAEKAEKAGVDALVAEGFEAGGHNGKDENTTFCLLPLIKQMTHLPLIAAGGIVSGQAIHAAMNLGADAVQIGSLFVASSESSAHENFKQKIIDSQDGATFLQMKQIAPVRLLKNEFSEKVRLAEDNCASKTELIHLLGKGRAKKGMFEGDLSEGELEIGQAVAQIHQVLSVAEIMDKLRQEFRVSIQNNKKIQDLF